MKELVVISGKGGTGKTSIVASFAALARDTVLADCDVDAPDLHLVLSPTPRRCEEFRSGREAVIRGADCTRCGACLVHCRYDAVRMNGRENGEADFSIDPASCEGCGVCVRFCPAGAIDFPERIAGEWYVSETRFGPMVHARLGIAAENSGKLVSVVRKEAKEIASRNGGSLILVDGPPGIGCPVIASVGGATAVLAVTEPTVSGEHDLKRVLALARHFQVPAMVCVNKWDINPAVTERIITAAAGTGAVCVGKVPYDCGVTDAQMSGRTVVEHSTGPAARSIIQLWGVTCKTIS